MQLPPSPEELQELCVKLAREAAALVVKQRDFLAKHGSIAQVTSTKTSEVDPVTAVDKASEAHIVKQLRELRPEDAIVGEEGSDIAGTTGVSWVIDPIDGTVNFLYGLPAYAVSVGAAVNGEFVAGCVVNVANSDCYYAASGSGAWVERGGEVRKLRASRADELATSLVATGFAYDAAWREKQADLLRLVLPRVRDIRRFGSAALDLCHLAEGGVDAYYEHGTHPWDYAAGAVIAAEAGATVRHPGLKDRGGEGALTAAAAPRVWEAFRELLESSGASNPLEGT